jgi:thiol:disulfide interchange protein DsbA
MASPDATAGSTTERIPLKRRHFSALAASLGLGLVRPADAQHAPVPGEDYADISPPSQTSAPPGTVDVVEFFSFACPHCFEFEPVLESWLAARKPAGIHFRRSPVPFLQNYANFQPMYFALDAMGLADSMPQKVFNAVHLEHQRLDKPDDIAAFMARNGVDATRFMALFNSFGVRTRVQQANALFEACGVSRVGVPALVVQGRWLTSPRQAKGTKEALAVVDSLAGRVRAGR